MNVKSSGERKPHPFFGFRNLSLKDLTLEIAISDAGVAERQPSIFASKILIEFRHGNKMANKYCVGNFFIFEELILVAKLG